MKFLNKIVLKTMAYSMGVLLPLTVQAAALEEIVVTAQKRAESVQDVPIAINALSGDLFDDLGISDTDDIEGLFPNLSTSESSAINTGFTIRGVGTNNFHMSVQQSVGVNIDDVASVSPFVSAIGVFDVDRVEVLRGPQNTLYGRNTTGGVINFHTRKANSDDDLNGRVILSAGDGGTQELEAAAGFAFSENIAGRIAIMDKTFDGLFTNIVDGTDVGQRDKQGARANLVWDISEDSTVDFTLSTGKAEGDALIARSVGNLNSDGSAGCSTFVGGGESAFTSGRNDCFTAITTNMVNGNAYLSGQLAAGNTDIVRSNPDSSNTANPYLVNYSSEWGTTYSHSSNTYNAGFDGYRIKFSHSFENMDLNWLTSYDETNVFSAQATNLAGFGVYQDAEFEVYQHELRLASTSDSALRWLAGLYISDQESIQDTWVLRTDAGTPGPGGLGVSPGIFIDSGYESVSVYGQLDYDFAEDWSVTIGARHTDDKLEGQTAKTACVGPLGQLTNGASFDGADTYDRAYRASTGCVDLTSTLIDTNPTQELSELGWKVGVSWAASSDSLVYANVSEGFKGGAYDNRALADGSSPIDPEYLTAFELGYKSQFLDNTLQLNAAAYVYNWVDLQIFGVIAGNPEQVNVPETKLKGFEMDLKWSPTDQFYIQGGFGYSDSEITDVTGVNVALGIVEGAAVTNTPEFSANILAAYTIPIGTHELVLQGSYRYEDESLFVLTNQGSPRSVKDSHNWLDLRASYSFGKELQHAVTLWGENVTQERSCQYNPSGLPGNVNWNCQITDPGVAIWGLTFETNF